MFAKNRAVNFVTLILLGILLDGISFADETGSASGASRRTLTFEHLDAIRGLPPARPPLITADDSLRWVLSMKQVREGVEKHFAQGFKTWIVTSQKEGTAINPEWNILIRSGSMLPAVYCRVRVNELGQTGESEFQEVRWQFEK